MWTSRWVSETGSDFYLCKDIVQAIFLGIEKSSEKRISCRMETYIKAAHFRGLNTKELRQSVCYSYEMSIVIAKKLYLFAR